MGIEFHGTKFIGNGIVASVPAGSKAKVKFVDCLMDSNGKVLEERDQVTHLRGALGLTPDASLAELLALLNTVKERGLGSPDEVKQTVEASTIIESVSNVAQTAAVISAWASDGTIGKVIDWLSNVL